MMAHTQSAPMQHFTCSLLATSASLHDDFVEGLIASGGGLNAIQNVMTNHHKKNPTVAASACGALGTIMSGVHPTLIVDQSHSMFTLIMTVMQNHEGHSEVNRAAVLVLSEICDRDPAFRESIGDMHGIPKIIDAVTQYLENEDVQLNGMSLIWKISSCPPKKNRLGGGGAKAVIDGMLFHIDSSLIQQEAMIALKNLATDSTGQQTSNVEMMQFQDHLPSLLMSAARDFPHDCEERADHVLSRMWH